MKKRSVVSVFSALVIAGAMAVSMSACTSEPSQENVSSTVSETISGANVDLTDAASILDHLQENDKAQAAMIMNFDVKQGSNTLAIETHSDITYLHEGRVKTVTTMLLSGQEVSQLETYTLEKDGKYYHYTGSGEDWSVTEIEKSDLDEKTNQITDSSFLKEVTDLKVADKKEKINNVETTVLEGSLRYDRIASLLGSTMDGFDLSGTDVPTKLYVDTDKMEIIKMYMDLKPVLESAQNTDSTDAASQMNINACYLDIEIKATGDDVQDFEVPADLPEPDDTAASSKA
ncbi:MAG: hypothetical protein PUC32_05955 [Oscillospiraceae bacterium]|nr:hypothetical protein [Oscillospiraceae bacterium]